MYLQAQHVAVDKIKALQKANCSSDGLRLYDKMEQIRI